MLNQNWFTTENMIMFSEGAYEQDFYDKDNKCFYLVKENENGINIQEIESNHSTYSDLYVEYIQYLADSKADNLSCSEFVDVIESEVEPLIACQDESIKKELNNDAIDQIYNEKFTISFNRYTTKLDFSADVYYKLMDALKEIVKGGDVE